MWTSPRWAAGLFRERRSERSRPLHPRAAIGPVHVLERGRGAGPEAPTVAASTGRVARCGQATSDPRQAATDTRFRALRSREQRSPTRWPDHGGQTGRVGGLEARGGAAPRLQAAAWWRPPTRPLARPPAL